jgi:four helix bundle protein
MLSDSVAYQKAKAFAKRIVFLGKHLKDEHQEYILSKQIVRSGTSIGANIRESYSAQSQADFIHKLSIALKEADESAYWLELLVESETIDTIMFDSLYNDLKEVSSMLAASIKTTKANLAPQNT